MSWFYLALLAPLFFAIVNLIDDNLVHHVYKGPYFGAIISGFFGALPLASLIFLDRQAVNPTVALMGVMAGVLTGVYYFFFFKALELESPSIVIAMFSLTPAAVPFLAYLFLGERLLAVQILGFIVVLLASFGLAMTEVRKFKFTKALKHVLAAALIFDIVSILSKHVYQSTDFYTGYMLFACGMGIGGLYFLLVLAFLKSQNIVKDLKQNAGKIIVLLVLAEFVAIVAEFTQNLAISRGPVSLVKVVGGIQPIYVLMIALLFYRFSPKHFREAAEGGLVKKFSLMSVILVGLYFISINQ